MYPCRLLTIMSALLWWSAINPVFIMTKPWKYLLKLLLVKHTRTRYRYPFNLPEYRVDKLLSDVITIVFLLIEKFTGACGMWRFNTTILQSALLYKAIKHFVTPENVSYKHLCCRVYRAGIRIGSHAFLQQNQLTKYLLYSWNNICDKISVLYCGL